MSLLEAYIVQVRELVKEANSSLYDSGEDVYENFVRRALRKYSIDKPLIKVSAVTGASSEYVIINSTNFPGFVDGWSNIEKIEAKAPTISKNDDPNYIERDEWEFYRNSTTYYVHFIGYCPSSSDTISFTYTIPHTINNLDAETVDSVPSIDFEAIVYWAANEACRSIAAKLSGTSDPTIRADVVNYRTKSSEFRAMAKEYREAYMDWISNPIHADGIVRDIDFGFGFGDTQPFLTHRSFSRR